MNEASGYSESGITVNLGRAIIRGSTVISLVNIRTRIVGSQ